MLGDAQTEAYEPVASIRNLFVNVGHRFPKYAGQGHLDIINNGVHNWGSRAMRLDPADFTMNEIGNYYQSGSGTAAKVDVWFGLHKIRTYNGMSLKIYTNDNYMSPDHLTNIKNWTDNDYYYSIGDFSPWYDEADILKYNTDNRFGYSRFHTGSTIPLNPSWFVSSPLTIQGVAPPIMPIAQVKQHLIDNVGARHYLNADGSVGEYLDNLQIKYLGYFANDSDVGRLDYESEYGEQASNVPSKTRPAGYDTDQDGMADIWEAATFGDLTQDSNGDFDGDGYTNIEEFINLVDK